MERIVKKIIMSPAEAYELSIVAFLIPYASSGRTLVLWKEREQNTICRLKMRHHQNVQACDARNDGQRTKS